MHLFKVFTVVIFCICLVISVESGDIDKAIANLKKVEISEAKSDDQLYANTKNILNAITIAGCEFLKAEVNSPQSRADDDAEGDQIRNLSKATLRAILALACKNKKLLGKFCVFLNNFPIEAV